MTNVHDFALPDVGEGLTEAEILRWLVHPGDVVTVNQLLVEIETAKAAVELPSPFAGTIVDLKVEPGQIVPVGTPIVSIELPDAAEAPGRQAVLVGYGVREQSPASRRRRVRGGAEPAAVEESVDEPAAADDLPPAARAKPPVRRLARELGVDLHSVRPTGANGDVTREDVLAAAGSTRPVSTPVSRVVPSDERVALHGVHRAMAEAMAESARTAPQVTEWVDVDMTRAGEVVARLRDAWQDAGVRVTVMTLAAAGLVRAVQEHPLANAAWSDDGPALLMRGAVNLGIAADTPRGLVVPVVKGAESLSLRGLAEGIQELIDRAREGRSTPAELTGGTVSLTNIGVFGIDGGTPLLPPGQAAILAIGRVVERPWVVAGAVVPRPVMQVTLTFDHRVMDGATGSRVLRSVADFLADPALALVADGA